MTAVSNSSPLIALAQISRLDLIYRLHTRVLVPPEVEREVRPTLPNLPAWIGVKALSRPPEPRVVSTTIGPGECEVISLGLEVNAERVILDDQPARRLAARLGLRVIGTLGLLLAAKDRGFVTRIKPELERLRDVQFFMDQDLYDRVIGQAGE
ncbi:MAG TPA: DUF3368 domain-containing protein [Bryobacteraceae bacterium]